MTNRTLIVDGQIFQTPAWHRGMGKYSVELLVALQKLSYWDSIEIVLSKHVAEEPSMRAQLTQQIKDIHIRELNLRPNQASSSKILRHNRKVLDKYLAGLVPETGIDFLILSLMQREIYPVFPTSPHIRKLLLTYDLIPLMFYEVYLADQTSRIEYLNKLKEFLRTDHYLTISKTVANDLTDFLGIDKTRITNIDGGPIDHSAHKQTINVPKPFILMPTGNELRKNNKRAVQGFNEFNKQQKYKYSLVITSFFKEKEIPRLKALAKNLVFVGNISGDKLEYLYESTTALLFPSKYEGLGLPILEAIVKNKPVVCSDISVFREMSGLFHYFDPDSATSIAMALSAMVKNPRVDRESYRKILKNYTWGKTARKFVEALDTTEVTKVTTDKIAVFGPDPSDKSPVGKNILIGHSELSRKFEIDYYFDPKTNLPTRAINFFPYITKAVPVTAGFAFNNSSYGGVLYHIDNQAACASTLFTALAVPGIIVLYDLKLEKVWMQMVQEGLIDTSRLVLEKEIDKVYGKKGTKYLVSLISGQKAVIVFNKQAENAVQEVLKNSGAVTKVYTMQFPNNPPAYPELVSAKTNEAFGYKDQALVIADIIGGVHG